MWLSMVWASSGNASGAGAQLRSRWWCLLMVSQCRLPPATLVRQSGKTFDYTTGIVGRVRLGTTVAQTGDFSQNDGISALVDTYGPSLRAIICRQSRPPELAVSCHERNIPGKVTQSASETAAILPPFLPHQPIFCLILINYDAEKLSEHGEKRNTTGIFHSVYRYR